MGRPQLDAQQQALAVELARLLGPEAEAFCLQLAQALAASTNADLFGDTQVVLRDLALRFAAGVCELHLRQKKTATSVPVCPAPSAVATLPTTTTTRAPS